MNSFENHLMGTVWLLSSLWFDLGLSQIAAVMKRLQLHPVLSARLLFMSLSLDRIQAAIAQLELLGALEQRAGQLTLTPVGRKMAAFPLEPKFAKVSDTPFSVPSLYLTLQVSHPTGSPQPSASRFIFTFSLKQSSTPALYQTSTYVLFSQAHIKSCVCACSVMTDSL